MTHLVGTVIKWLKEWIKDSEEVAKNYPESHLPGYNNTSGVIIKVATRNYGTDLRPFSRNHNWQNFFDWVCKGTKEKGRCNLDSKVENECTQIRLDGTRKTLSGCYLGVDSNTLNQNLKEHN